MQRICIILVLLYGYGNGQVEISSHGDMTENSTLILECKIQGFSSSPASASWQRNDGSGLVTCDRFDLCSVVVDGIFRYSGNDTGIYVTIRPLSQTENGKQWTCTFSGLNDTFTVTITTDSRGFGGSLLVVNAIGVCVGFYYGCKVLYLIIILLIWWKYLDIYSAYTYKIELIGLCVVTALPVVLMGVLLDNLNGEMVGVAIGTPVVLTLIVLFCIVLFVYVIVPKFKIDKKIAKVVVGTLMIVVWLTIVLWYTMFLVLTIDVLHASLLVYTIYSKLGTGKGNSNTRLSRNGTVAPETIRGNPEGAEGRRTEAETNARHVATSALDFVPPNRELPRPMLQLNDVESGQKANILPPLTDESENPLQKRKKEKKKNKEQDINETDVN